MPRRNEPRSSSNQKGHQRRAGVLLISPALFLILVTLLVPLAAAIVLSFTRYDLFRHPAWAGLQNYRRLFDDPVFWTAAGNTLRFAVGQVVIGVIVAVAVAVLFNQQVAAGSFLRTVVYLPQAASYVVVALIWTMLLDPFSGPISQAFAALTGHRIYFLSDADLAMPSLIVMSLWRNLGYFMIILLAALQSVPTELLEAAQVDGANAWRRFIHVTVPGIASALLFVTITWFLGAVQMFTQSYVMTSGGPVNATRTLVYLMYQRAFSGLDIGGASAIAVLLFGAVVVLSVLVRLIGFVRGRTA